MNEQDFLNFKSSMAALSLEDLEKKQTELKQSLGKMVTNVDLIIKVSILDSLIEERKNG